MSLSDLTVAGQDQSGSVLVIVAIWMSVLVAFLGFAVEVGNWFTHKRHLQLQADAAALAAAGKYVVPCTDQPIIDMAQKYGGVNGDSYNLQIGGTPLGKIHMLVNSTTYYNQTSPVDTTVNTSGPCDAKMIDVKMTETDLPWFFRKLNVPFINAHARVAIRSVDTQKNALPVAVPEVNPKAGRVYFVDESKPTTDAGYVLASAPMTKTGTANGLAIWDNSAAPTSLPINADKIGVRIALSGQTSTTCGNPLVRCYDAGSANGLEQIRAWDGSASANQASNPPRIRDLTLIDGSCSDAYFSSDTSQCTIGVSAKIDAKDSSGNNLPNSKLIYTATVGGKDYPLAFNSTNNRWETATSIPISPGVGPTDISMKWEEQQGTYNGNTCSTSGGNKCKDTFGVVQRHYSATDSGSGPIKLVQVWEGGVFGSNSFPKGSTHTLVVKVGIQGSLQDATSVNDPKVTLRVGGGGSQNQSLDCDPAIPNFKTELAQGCGPTYTINNGSACPATYSALQGTTQPWNCVASDTGAAVNQVPDGLNQRILGTTSPTSCVDTNGISRLNNWANFPNIPNDDPRIVHLFITPFGAFSGSGQEVVPVTGFATFYITGWVGSGGKSDPCPGDDFNSSDPAGTIYGHFIKYIQTLNDGSGGSQFCDFNSFNTCVAKLEE